MVWLVRVEKDRSMLLFQARLIHLGNHSSRRLLERLELRLKGLRYR